MFVLLLSVAAFRSAAFVGAIIFVATLAAKQINPVCVRPLAHGEVRDQGCQAASTGCRSLIFGGWLVPDKSHNRKGSS